MLIGWVVSSEVNCGPGLQVIREAGAEHRGVVVLPGGLVAIALIYQFSIDLMSRSQLERQGLGLTEAKYFFCLSLFFSANV